MTTPARTPLHAKFAQAVKTPVGDTAELLHRSGPLKFGQGMIATILALSLAVLCLLAVLAFHFPEYLTTPETRPKYSADVRGSALLFVGIEKLLPLYRNQAVFRPEWQTDLKHFAVNHFLVGLILLTV